MKKEDEAVAPAKSLLAAGLRILYVDDEEGLVSLAKRMIPRLGHGVSGFTDPKEALKTFRAHPQDYDIVVTDLAMPGMSGFDLARQVLALRPQIPVLMTTGNIRDDDVHHAHEAGIREVLLKPVTADELRRVLDRLSRDANPNGKLSA